MANDLIEINQNSKIALEKTKNLLSITKEILKKQDNEWLNILLDWAKKNIIQEGTNFPKTKEELLRVKHVSIRWNRLKAIPKELFELEQIEILELNNNALEALPNELENLSNLKQLNLNINGLKTLPRGIEKLQKLNFLNIKNNKYLELSNEQISWLNELKQSGCNILYDKYKFDLGE